jgi:hypothetical protein
LNSFILKQKKAVTIKMYSVNRIILIFIFLLSSTALFANTIIVSTTDDSGAGSLRDAFDTATDSDTIFIDVKGVLSLSSTISIIGKSNLTVIGPYPKHFSIQVAGSWTGSLITISNSTNISFRGVGFTGGTGTNRFVLINDSSSDILFSECLFEGGDFSGAGFSGGAVGISNSSAKFIACSFIDNTGLTGGAVAIVSTEDVSFTNCTFSGNESTGAGGAIDINSSGNYSFFHCSFYNNNGGSSPEVMRASAASNVTLENNAFGNNGTGQQFDLNGGVTNYGGNRGKTNYALEFLTLPLLGSDIFTTGLTLGIRGNILEDGFGLKYWPIVDGGSDLINVKTPNVRTPAKDCRRAPRSLLGPSAVLAYPDAGAVEFTHLRVTNNLEDAGTPNSLLWAFTAAVRKDNVHYVEFDIPTPLELSLDNTITITDKAYIVDGFSQPLSAIPGPALVGSSELTPANLPISLNNTGALTDAFQIDPGTDNSIIQGIRIQGYTEAGIANLSSNIGIFGNEIGLTALNVENGNESTGILTESGNNVQIGGIEHAMRNIISGNGLGLGGEQANISVKSGRNVNIHGNIVGVNNLGTDVITSGSHAQYGILINSDGNNIGAAVLRGGNIIGDNEFGIYLDNADSTAIYSNKIGVAEDGTTAIDNFDSGILLKGSNVTKIGGTSPLKANIISKNGTGINIGGYGGESNKNSILGNSIYDNNMQGIDLLGDGLVLPNDTLLVPLSQNSEIDFPQLIESITCAASNTRTTYQLNLPVGSNCRVEFFSISTPDLTNGEGETLIGFHEVMCTEIPQIFEFDHGYEIPEGTIISATVTRFNSGNTSEFSNNLSVAYEGDASFTMDDFCPDSLGIAVVLGDPTVFYSFTSPFPVDGAELDSLTGVLTGGIQGTTYELLRNVDVCANNDTVSVTVIDLDPSFTFDDFCPGTIGTPSAIATPGGVFSFQDIPIDGATINASTGEITGGVEGNSYHVVYDLEQCAFKDTVTVSVIATDESFTLDDFCAETSDAAVTATPGGTFYFGPDLADGATINAATGVIDNAIEGTDYTVVYEVGVCSEVDSVIVNVIETDESFTFSDFCPGTDGTPVITGDAGGTFSFLAPAPVDGASINTTTGIVSDGVEGNSYTIIYTVGVCNDKDTATALVTPTDESFDFEDFCPALSGFPSAIATSGGTFSFAPDLLDGAALNATTGELTGGIEGTSYAIEYTVGACSEVDTVTVTVIETDESFTLDDFCAETSDAAVTATPGGTFYFGTRFSGWSNHQCRNRCH